MRRKAPMRWIEEAEARRVWLYDAESKPADAETLAGPEFLLATKTTLTVLVARMAGRVARAARGRSAAGEKDKSAGGCDEAASWIEFARRAPYRLTGASAGTDGRACASSYSRGTSLLA